MTQILPLIIVIALLLAIIAWQHTRCRQMRHTTTPASSPTKPALSSAGGTSDTDGNAEEASGTEAFSASENTYSADGAETDATPDDSSEEGSAAARTNILLLYEDDDTLRESLARQLSDEYEIIIADTPEHLIATAHTIGPDVIVAEQPAPCLDRDDLCFTLCSSIDTSHIPVILLSAWGDDESIIYGLQAGATDYIVRPFDMEILRLRLRRILDMRQHLHQSILQSPRGSQPISTSDYASQMDREFLKRVDTVVEEQLSNADFSIDHLCSSLAMSRTAVYNKLKHLTGQAPGDYIRIRRMAYANTLLLTGRYSIAEVAVKAGYTDPKYFSTSFKKHFGISPSKVKPQ